MNPMPARKPILLPYARRLRQDWVDRWPWIIRAAVLVLLMVVVGAYLLFIWFLLGGRLP